MERRQRLAELIVKAGSHRKAVALIEQVKGVAPTHSALYKAEHGSSTEYVVQCYIEDLEKAFNPL